MKTICPLLLILICASGGRPLNAGDNLGTPTTPRANPATGNPIDPTKTLPTEK